MYIHVQIHKKRFNSVSEGSTKNHDLVSTFSFSHNPLELRNQARAHVTVVLTPRPDDRARPATISQRHVWRHMERSAPVQTRNEAQQTMTLALAWWRHSRKARAGELVRNEMLVRRATWLLRFSTVVILFGTESEHWNFLLQISVKISLNQLVKIIHKNCRKWNLSEL